MKFGKTDEQRYESDANIKEPYLCTTLSLKYWIDQYAAIRYDKRPAIIDKQPQSKNLSPSPPCVFTA